MKRQLPILIVFLSGMTMLIDYYFPRVPFFHGAREVFLNWGRIGLTFAMILGVMNLLVSNLKKVVLRSQGWIYNLVLLSSFAVTLWYSIPYKVIANGANVSTWQGTDVGTTGFKIFMNVYAPLSATIFALVAFYIASAAFRAFRAKNVEAILLLVSAGIVMLGSVPVGDEIFNWCHLGGIFGAHNFSWLSTEIQQIPMTAGQRAILFGVAIGMVSMSIKILSGVDSSYFGGSE